ncbi:hypothetical protein NOR_08064 [Metarhizium rileyi]|uniref:Mid2 domain-containing protein n=1 Tax=Metarhizium rileyi (strain RCEF 4871) TaxID=1649241 RepID=A0A166X0Y3_METRR|nr:hypothetical protein NOR_08064 [Metarhizium rileyi RCEF 4871]
MTTHRTPRMNHLHVLAVLLAALVSRVASRSSFITPPPPGPAGNYQDNPTHKEGQQLEFQWTSNLKRINLGMWQEYPTPRDGNGTAYYQSLLEGSKETSLSWTVSLAHFSRNVGKGEAAILYLAIYDAETNARDTTCHYFNVTAARDSTSISISASASSSTVLSTPTKSASTSWSTGLSTPTTSPDTKSPGLTTGAAVGVAIGAVIGGLVVISTLGFLSWRCSRRTKRSSGRAVPAYPVLSGKPELEATSYQPRFEEGRYTQHDGPRPIYEAP